MKSDWMPGFNRRNSRRASEFHATRRFGALFLGGVLLSGSTHTAMAQSENFCGTQEEVFGDGCTSTDAVMPALIGETRALVVFAQFPEAYNVPHCDTTSAGWPNGNAIPAWADTLLEDTDEPEIEGSLTHFYWTMSEGKHVLRGVEYPSVVTAPLTVNEYAETYGQGGTPEEQGMRMIRAANGDIVRVVIQDLDTDALDFDLNEDGFFDQIFIYWRSPLGGPNGPSITRMQFGGIANLVECDTTYTLSNQETIKVGRRSGTANFGAVRFPNVGDPVRMINRWQALGLMAHEYGHNLGWGHSCGLFPFDVMQSVGLPTGWNPSTMVGAWRRLDADWIEPLEIDSMVTGADTTIVLVNAATHGSQGTAIVRTHKNGPSNVSTTQYFLLECRNAEESPYLRGHPEVECGSETSFSGLVIYHVVLGGTCWTQGHPAAPYVDPELAEGLFDSTGAPDPVHGIDAMTYNPATFDTAENNLFQAGPGSEGWSNAFTPFTNPNTNCYADTLAGGLPLVSPLKRQDVYSGISIYNIGWTSSAKESMLVSVRFDGTTPPAGADTLKGDMHWEGRVQLTGDLVVPEGVTLTLAKGAQVIFGAETDRHAGGSDTSRVEFLVAGGQVKAEGEVSEAVVFTSSRDNDFEHFEGPGEDTGPAPGDWGSLRFNLAGCECTGYGYSSGVGPPSSVEHAEIKYASRGISIENFRAPDLIGVTFSEIADSHHIYLDSTDVFIPHGYWTGGSCFEGSFVAQRGRWGLVGGTHVVAANGASQDLSCLGVDDKVDLVPYGLLDTDGSTAAGDSVYFRPEDPTDPSEETAGRDWGGIFMPYESRGSSIRFADIGYAANPLFLDYPDSTTIATSRIHDFAETGLWAHGSLGEGAGIAIDSVTVERGDELHDELGGLGVYLDQTDGATLEHSLISLEGRDTLLSGSAGLSIRYGKTFCESDPASTRTLLVEKNVILGPGNESEQIDEGIATNWVCGSALREAEISNNRGPVPSLVEKGNGVVSG